MTWYSTRHADTDLHYRIDDLRLPWLDDAGTVLFHHGLGACADSWQGWLPALAARHRAVRLDMRGHGRSRCPPGFRWSLESMLGDLQAVADASTDGPFHLVGESIGGTLALAFAATWPERVRTLTISNGAYAGGSLGSLDDWAGLMGREGMQGWSRMMMQRRFYPGALSTAAARWYEQQQASADPAAVLDALRVLVGTDLGASLDRVRMPVLILHPDASPFIPVSQAAALCERLTDARLQVFAHTRHGLPFSHAEQCAALLARFVAERG